MKWYVTKIKIKKEGFSGGPVETSEPSGEDPIEDEGDKMGRAANNGTTFWKIEVFHTCETREP
jgi:hypothetical protein